MIAKLIITAFALSTSSATPTPKYGNQVTFY
jgi:hypothetical protein